MKKLFLLSSLLWLVLSASYAQIDPSIPTPKDLQNEDTKIITKTRLDDGTIVIRYIDKQGRTMQRRTKKSPDGGETKQEWDEANPPKEDVPRPAGQAQPGAGMTSGSGEVRAAGQTGDEKKAEGALGENPKPVTQERDGLKAAGEDANDAGKVAPSESAKKAADEAKKAAEAAAEEIENPKTKGTGQTTGIIGNITLTNHNDFPVAILPQTFFIPSDGKYQSYVGRIEEGNTIPPNSTQDLPVSGYCTDIHTPPVPSGENMPPVSTWIPVGSTSSPPGITSKPPGTTEPINPPGGSITPPDVVLVPISTTPTVSAFTPADIPGITHSTGYKPVSTPNPNIIITWPGTDQPVGGTLDPVPDPSTFAPVIVAVLEAIEDAVVVVQESGIIHTPISSNPEKERESIIQQTFWIYNAIITGKKYTKEDFINNAYTQFEDVNGQVVTNLPEEKKEQLDAGLTDFWNTFQVTGVAAKVLHAESPGISQDDARLGKQLGNTFQDSDKVPATEEKEEEEFQCECPDTISYSISVKTGKDTYKQLDFKGPKNVFEQEVKVDNLKFGDTLSVKAFNVVADCTCAGTRCDMTWELNFHSTRSNNCDEHNIDTKNNLIWIKTKAANKKNKAIIAYFYLYINCNAPGCAGCTCYRDFQLTLKDTKSK